MRTSLVQKKFQNCKKGTDLATCSLTAAKKSELTDMWFTLSIDTTKSTVVVAETRATEGSISVSENEFNIDYPYWLPDGSIRKTIVISRLTGGLVSNVRRRDLDVLIGFGVGECTAGTKKF